MPAICFLLFILASHFGFSDSTRLQQDYRGHFFSGQARFITPNSRLSKPLIGEGGRIYACSDNMLFAFETNGSIAWLLPLSFKCNISHAPVDGGRGKIYLIAENRVLQINVMKIGTSEPAAEVFFGPGPGQHGGDEIVGVVVSTLSSSVFINVKNRGLFAYMTRGQLLWSAGPVLVQDGYKQGCAKDVLDCYFSSVPVIDQCEASVYISNTKGELYALWLRSPHFKWIQDLSSFDKVYSITPGNNGRLYVTVPVKSLVLALDVSSGIILWQKSVGPLSSAYSSPVVDSYGWVTIGSLDGFLYSFSPTGTLKKFPKAAALDSVIQFTPFLDCSGYAVYFCQTEMEGKVIHTNEEYTYVSAMKPKSSVFTLMVPSRGKVYWSESIHGSLISTLSKSDVQNFVVDEGMLLAFVTASKTGNPLPCRSQGLKLQSGCSQLTSKRLSVYPGNRRAMLLFLLFESLLLVLLAALVRFCCVFWRKKKLQDQDLGRFLEKRRSLQVKKKEFDRRITELEAEAAEEAVEKLEDLVRERQGIERKLSTTYSLGRDGPVSRSKSLLPSYSYSGKTRRENVTIFHTLTSTTSSEESSGERDMSSEFEEEDEEEEVEAVAVGKGKAKAAIEAESSSSDDEQLIRRKYERSPSEPASSSKGYMSSLSVEQESGARSSQSTWLKRRNTLTLSSSN